MERHEMDDLMDKHFRAEESGDIAAAVAVLGDDVDHELAGVHHGHGHAAASAFYADLFGRLRLRRIETSRRMYGPDFAVDEAVVDAETVAGEPAPFRLLHVFEFADGRISRECAWRAPVDDA